MTIPDFSPIPVILIAGTATSLMIVRNWRWMIVLLVIQYIGVFWMISSIWPVGLAAVKLIVGWMAAAVLGASRSTFEVEDSEFRSVSGRIFRGLAAGIVWVLVFSIAGPMQYWIPAPLPILQGGLMLFGMGLYHLGMTTNPMRVVVGLLTVMAGFEILHASIEASVLLAGLMGVVNLGLSLMGAYTLLSATLETAE
ncbi:MAG TPA: hypothetical protein VLH85_09410 [Levilinea sp.]|nr:hypothetical protein [Levilinea sp.]